MSRLLEVRLGRVKWEGDAEVTFRGYLEELQQLVGMVDRMPKTAVSTVRP
jgi:hypothetical protein